MVTEGLHMWLCSQTAGSGKSWTGYYDTYLQATPTWWATFIVHIQEQISGGILDYTNHKATNIYGLFTSLNTFMKYMEQVT